MTEKTLYIKDLVELTDEECAAVNLFVNSMCSVGPYLEGRSAEHVGVAHFLKHTKGHFDSKPNYVKHDDVIKPVIERLQAALKAHPL